MTCGDEVGDHDQRTVLTHQVPYWGGQPLWRLTKRADAAMGAACYPTAPMQASHSR